MTTLKERVENIEAILIHKFKTLDLEVIKEKDEAFFKEAFERLDEINERLDKQ